MNARLLVSFGVSFFMGMGNCLAGPSQSKGALNLNASINEGFEATRKTEKKLMGQGRIANFTEEAKRVRHRRHREVVVVIESENIAVSSSKPTPTPKVNKRDLVVNKKIQRLIASEVESAR